MRYTRHFWLLVIALICLGTIVAWKTPEVAKTALADPHYSDSQRMLVQRYWNLLDARQLDLAGELFLAGPGGTQQEFMAWQHMLQDNHFVSIAKLEFLDSNSPDNTRVRVTWSTPLHGKTSAVYSFGVKRTEQGWRITEIKLVDSLSFGGGNSYGVPWS